MIHFSSTNLNFDTNLNVFLKFLKFLNVFLDLLFKKNILFFQMVISLVSEGEQSDSNPVSITNGLRSLTS